MSINLVLLSECHSNHLATVAMATNHMYCCHHHMVVCMGAQYQWNRGKIGGYLKCGKMYVHDGWHFVLVCIVPCDQRIGGNYGNGLCPSEASSTEGTILEIIRDHQSFEGKQEKKSCYSSRYHHAVNPMTWGRHSWGSEWHIVPKIFK